MMIRSAAGQRLLHQRCSACNAARVVELVVENAVELPADPAVRIFEPVVTFKLRAQLGAGFSEGGIHKAPLVRQ